eukprot:1186328-Prorocentrum_minimum.AAC.4
MPYSRYDLLIQRSKSTVDSTRLSPETRRPLKRLGYTRKTSSLPQQTFTLTAMAARRGRVLSGNARYDSYVMFSQLRYVWESRWEPRGHD